MALVVLTVPKDAPGEALAFGVFALLAPPIGDLLSPGRSDPLPNPEPLEIGVFPPDDAAADEIEELRAQCETAGLSGPVKRSEFLEIVERICWVERGSFVAFTVPTDIGRLAVAWSRAVKEPGRGGFSQILWTRPGTGIRKHQTLPNGEIEDFARPRIVTRGIDARRALLQFKPAKDRAYWPGVFISVQALAEALSGRDLTTLAEACDAFEVETSSPLDGSLCSIAEELRSMCRLYRRLLERHLELCPDQPPTTAVSAGTYSQALLRQTDLDAPLSRWPEFPRDVLAATMGAYFAGEVFCHARGTSLPIRTLDFGGAYALAATLIGAFEALAAQDAKIIDENPDQVAHRIEALARKLVRFERGTGPPPSKSDLRFAAWTTVFIETEGALLPHRPRRGETWTARRAPLWTRGGILPYQVADVLVHVMEGGSCPPIVRALSLRPVGRRPLKPVRLPTGRMVDPSSEDLVLALATERARLEFDEERSPVERLRLRGLLKSMTNALVSGLPVQVNDDEPTKLLRPQVIYDPRDGHAEEVQLPVVERPGPWYFPPIAAAVTATARLLLHLAIGTARALGGTVAYWDTDSIFIVASPQGGLLPFPGGEHRTEHGGEAIRTLSYAEVEVVRERIELLSPFPSELGPYVDVTGKDGNWVRVRRPRLLRVEPENEPGLRGFATKLHLTASAPKRYVVHRAELPGPHVEILDDRGVVVEPTTKQLRDLTRIEVVRPSEHGLPFLAPEGSPAWIEEGFEYLLRLHLGLPAELPAWWGLPHVALLPASRPEIASLHPDARPFCRLAVMHIPLAGPVIAPWHEGIDASSAEWRELGGRQVRVRMRDGTWLAETLGQVFLTVWRSADSGALDPNGVLAGAEAIGLLTPAPTRVTGVQRIGKESRHLGVGREILTGPEHVDYGGDENWPILHKALQLVAVTQRAKVALAEEVGVSVRWIEAMAAGRMPSKEIERRLVSALAMRARAWIRDGRVDRELPRNDVGLLALYLDTSPGPLRLCEECGYQLTGRRQRWCSDACRKRHERLAPEQLGLDTAQALSNPASQPQAPQGVGPSSFWLRD